MRFRRMAGLAVLAVLACADANDASQDAAPTPEASAAAASEVARTYAAELDVNLDDMRRTASGLYVQDLQEGTGAGIEAGQSAVVHYTGWLPDGTEFDSSRDSDPFIVTVGVGQVIAGWDEGLLGLRKGGQRRLVIPPHLAYGAAGAGGVIPPNATLVFDVELLGIIADDTTSTPADTTP